MTLVPPTDLQCLRLQLQPVVLGLQVLDAVLGLAQLGLQLSLQLPASLLELQQLLLGLLAAAGGDRRKSSADEDEGTELKTAQVGEIGPVSFCEETSQKQQHGLVCCRN